MKIGNSNYACGIANEERVARYIKRHYGASKVDISPGSRGSADLTAIFPSGKIWSIQVKSTCTIDGKPKRLSNAEITRLVRDARRKKHTPIYAKVKGRKIDLEYVNSRKKIIKSDDTNSFSKNLGSLFLFGAVVYIGVKIIQSNKQNITTAPHTKPHTPASPVPSP